MERPLVSVLMTAYNREKYIAESIQSVLDSTYTNFELIIVDDRSSDNTVQIANEFVAKDSRVKVYVNEENLGDYPNRNRAASLANGKYLKYVDSDDLIYPHGLEVMVHAMERYPNAAHGFPRYNMPYGPHPIQLTPEQAFREYYLGDALFNHAPNSVIIRKDRFFEEGCFTSQSWILDAALGDTEMWMRLGFKYPTAVFAGEVVWGRVHGEQESYYKQKGHKVVVAQHRLAVSYMSKANKYFTKEEEGRARKRLDRNYARYIMSQIFRKLDLRGTYKLYRNSGLSMSSFLSGFFGYAK